VLTRRLLADAWGGLAPATVARLAMLLLLFNVIAIIPTLPAQRTGFHGGPYLVGFLAMQIKGFAVVMLVLVADRISDARRSALWPYAAAVILGVTSGAMLLWLLTQWLLQVPTAVASAKGLAYEPFLSFTHRHTNGAMMVFFLATAAYVLRRRALQRLDALRASQERRAELEQQLLKTRLAIMRSRVEPASIVAALTGAESLYQKDPAAGAQALQDLAHKLRGALAETRRVTTNMASQSLTST
jgi:hypothetical protein